LGNNLDVGVGSRAGVRRDSWSEQAVDLSKQATSLSGLWSCENELDAARGMRLGGLAGWLAALGLFGTGLTIAGDRSSDGDL
jgi:hypothetical protein